MATRCVLFPPQWPNVLDSGVSFCWGFWEHTVWSRAHPDLRQSRWDLVASGGEGLVENLALEQGLLCHYLMDLQRSRQPCPIPSPPTAPGSHRERTRLNKHTGIKSFGKLKKVFQCWTNMLHSAKCWTPLCQADGEKTRGTDDSWKHIKVQKKENLNCSSRGWGRCSGAEGVGMGWGRGMFERAKQTAAKPVKGTRKWEH